MGKYNVVVASRVKGQLLQCAEFLSRVSVSAALRFRDEFENALVSLEENPYQFPYDTDLNLPDRKYRKAIFAKRYKILFSIYNTTVRVSAVVDCRQMLTRGKIEN